MKNTIWWESLKKCQVLFDLKENIYLVFAKSVSQSVQSLSRVWLFATPWIAAHQASLSITNSQSSLRLTSIESVMSSSHLILCRPLLLPLIPPSIRVFSNESTLRMRWPKYYINHKSIQNKTSTKSNRNVTKSTYQQQETLRKVRNTGTDTPCFIALLVFCTSVCNPVTHWRFVATLHQASLFGSTFPTAFSHFMSMS